MKTPRYAVGDIVRVKTLDELRRDLGEAMETPCNFVEEMYEFCGQCLEVIGVYDVHDKGENFYYVLQGGDSWNFDECVLDDFFIADEPNIDISSLSMNYESLF